MDAAQKDSYCLYRIQERSYISSRWKKRGEQPGKHFSQQIIHYASIRPASAPPKHRTQGGETEREKRELQCFTDQFIIPSNK